MANMIPISTVTVGSGGAATINFTSIPQTYTDLMVKISNKSTQTNTLVTIKMRLNNSTTGITWRNLVAEGTTAGSYDQAAYGGDTTIHGTSVGDVAATTSTFSQFEAYIPNYTSSAYKTYSTESVSEGTFSGAYGWFLSGLWSNTAAVTSLNFALDGTGNFAQYTTATLYGIRKN